MRVAPLGADHLPAVAHLHAGALAGDFLPSLGEPFLRTFYQAALRLGLAFGFVVEGEGELYGFVLGSADTSALFRKTVLSAGPALAWAALPAVLRRPGLLLKVAETFLYPSREAAVPQPAELLVIAVSEERRGQRIGEALVSALSQAFCERGIPAYKVTVLQQNAGANRFYQRLGFRLAGSFNLYRRGWNLYLYSTGETSL